MTETIFSGIFDTTTTTSTITIFGFLACIMVALVIGIIIAVSHSYKNKTSKSFIMTVAILPAVVRVVIMMVNGNIGAGVAVAGAFSLVRFRSVPGTAKEITAIFLAMSAGLTVGMGYLVFGLIFTILLSVITMIYTNVNLNGIVSSANDKVLRITIPEDLDYSDIFEDIFTKYTLHHEIIAVKTTNMGSMFKLTYNVTIKDISQEKAFIDEIRCRNGNLEITISKQEIDNNSL